MSKLLADDIKAGGRFGIRLKTLVLFLSAVMGTVGLWGCWYAADVLMRHDAVMEAERWAHYLKDNTQDSALMVQGLPPSADTQDTLRHAHEFGEVAEIAFYSTTGKVQFYEKLKRHSHTPSAGEDNRADAEDVEDQQNLFDRLPSLRKSQISGKKMFVKMRDADDPEESGFETEVVFALSNGESVIGYVLIELDQTARWSKIKKTILPISILGALFFTFVPIGFAAAFQNKSNRMKKLAAEANLDELTGLGSRRGLFAFEKEFIGPHGAPPDGTAVLYLDIDKFKRLNDNYGHEHGDQLLKSIGGVIRTMCEADPSLRAFRLGGDEFVLIQLNVNDPNAVLELAGNLEHMTFEEMVENVGAPTCSIGVAISSQEIKAKSLEELISFADHALYVCKDKGGRTTTLFDASMEHELLQQKYISGLLDRSHETKPFILHYQPFFDFESSELSGFEALVRMHDLTGQLIPPDKFISIAERTGVIEEIGAKCLIAACAEAKKWPPHLKVAVNISPVQFRSGNLLSHIRTALKLSDLHPSQLEIEVTESVLMDGFDHVTAQLKEIQETGIKVALDDFGTGFSSLSYLWRFSFDKVKIDKAFTQNIEHDDSAFRILAAIIELANQIGFATTAEGIETVKQQTTLRELGCTFGQGYLMGRPSDAENTRLTILGAIHAKMAEVSETPASEAGDIAA